MYFTYSHMSTVFRKSMKVTAIQGYEKLVHVLVLDIIEACLFSQKVK